MVLVLCNVQSGLARTRNTSNSATSGHAGAASLRQRILEKSTSTAVREYRSTSCRRQGVPPPQPRHVNTLNSIGINQHKSNLHRINQSKYLRIRAGTPATIARGGTLSVTTAPAPTIASSPISSPTFGRGMMIELTPKVTRSPMTTRSGAPSATAPAIVTW